MQCADAREMANSTSMPRPMDILNTDDEWLLHLLNDLAEEQRLPVIMTCWRNWHVRNEIIHHKPSPTVKASRRFLCSYIESL